MAPTVKFYKIPKWRDYQHYKDRSPPWIKLHFDLLTSETWLSLDDASRVLAVASMLIASRNEGRIPGSPTYMQRVAYLSGPANFAPLVECGFLVVDDEIASENVDSASKTSDAASNALASCKQLLADASPETETEKSKPSCAIASHGIVGKDDPKGFSECWEAYPKRLGGNSRVQAEKQYRARLKAGTPPADLLAGVQRYAAFIRATEREGTAYVKQASTFFGTGEHWREPWELPGTSAASGDWRMDPAFRGCA